MQLSANILLDIIMPGCWGGNGIKIWSIGPYIFVFLHPGSYVTFY